MTIRPSKPMAAMAPGGPARRVRATTARSFERSSTTSFVPPSTAARWSFADASAVTRASRRCQDTTSPETVRRVTTPLSVSAANSPHVPVASAVGCSAGTRASSGTVPSPSDPQPTTSAAAASTVAIAGGGRRIARSTATITVALRHIRSPGYIHP